MKKRLFFQIGTILLMVLLFVGFNASVYVLLTRRLSNNFSDTSQAKMVDVAAFLPFEDGSDLAHIDTDFSMDGELPVLDGAAALVPVYASIIDSVYPKGCVTYEGGVFSDDNYYGENFAPDSKMQYKNTVRGYKAIVDGETDILFCAAPSAEQIAYAEAQGVELVYVPVGLEAFVFFVNADNPVESLTVDEIPSHEHNVPVYWGASGSSSVTIQGMESSAPNRYPNWINNTDATGGGEPHNNMPPYLAVYMWLRRR